MKVSFAQFGNSLASSRLRALMPQQELEKLGIQQGFDVLVYGKHWLPMKAVKPFPKRVFDCCDDHFDTPLGDYYREHIAAADAVTCNSQVMREIIKRETGRIATVIPEPYEGEEGTPDIGPGLLWFGHASNLRDYERLGVEAKVLTNKPPHEAWTPESFAREIAKPCIVVIPTGKSMAKSENRMVETIRRGRYACAEYLPAYEPFYRFFPCRNIKEHVEMALSDKEASLRAIHAAQDFIRHRYAPETIAKQWLEVLNNL